MLNKLDKKCRKYFVKAFIVFYAFILVLYLLPIKPSFLKFENRELTQFPVYSLENWLSGKYFDEFSNWLSDRFPFRDALLVCYTRLKSLKGIEQETKVISIKNVNKVQENVETTVIEEDISETIAETIRETIALEEIANDEENIIQDYDTISDNCIITGHGEDTRAMYLVWGHNDNCLKYADTINMFADTFKNVYVYSMLVPLQITYYAPEEYKKYADNNLDIINHINARLNSNVYTVDVIRTLAKHRDEYIYLKTDHHWAPLGAWYAAEEFAKVAEVTFKDRSNYETKQIKSYMGSVYRFTEDARLLDCRDVLEYYIPKVEYKSERFRYNLDAVGNPIGHNEFTDSPYFFEDKASYNVFLGGDNNTTHVHINNNSGRRLMVIKDSFGNPVPSNLFFGFDDIYIVDYRYFIDDFVTFVEAAGITDLLFINNVELVRNESLYKKCQKLLIRKN